MVIKRVEAGLTEHSTSLLGILEEIWQKLQPQLGSSNYTGCVVQIERLTLPPIATTLLVGQVGKHEDRLIELVNEKNTRVRLRNSSDGHQTSMQSRDPCRAQLGGAIVTKYAMAGVSSPLIIGVAGLTEEANEAFALTVARVAGFLDREAADALAAMGSNHLYLGLLTAAA